MVFESGRDLSRAFHTEVLAPVLTGLDLPYAAALLGPGSDVLGYDTQRSTDHDWGPRALVLVAATDVARVRAAVEAILPARLHGNPVRLTGDTGTPMISVQTLTDWTVATLGLDPLARDLTPADWLCLPQQRLLETTAGVVLHDDTGDLTRLRAALSAYPDDVWWWMLASAWRRLAQEEAFPQRTAELGDELGSAVLTARLARDIMGIALLMNRQYAPYGKWLGTAFARMPQWDSLPEHLAGALGASSPDEADHHLLYALESVARRFNTLAPGDDLDPRPRRFHDRPAMVLGSERFAQAALARVDDPLLRHVPLIGSVDQWVDSTDLLRDPVRCQALRSLYNAGPQT